MKNNLHFSSQKAPRAVFWAAVAVIVLPIIILPPYWQPSDWTRAILFRLIMTALVSFLLFAFFYKKEASFSLPKWNIQLYLPLFALTAFFVTLLVATIFSQDITFSIFGSPARTGGMLNLLFYFLFSILLALFINKAQWEKLFKTLFITGIMASGLAMVQYFNLLKSVFISFEAGSTPSFLGNSTILAIYMLFLSFLAFTFFIQKQTKKEKAAYGVLVLLFIFTIVITGSRAAYLGLLAGFLYFFLFYPYPKKYKTLKIAAASLLLAAVLAITVFNLFPQLGEKNNLLKTVTTRVALERISKDIFGTRLSVWKMTARAIQDKPLLGYGPENFYIGFEKYYDPTQFDTPILLWDRPHNIFLEVAVNSGIISLLLYMAFWITLFWKLGRVKNAQKKDDYYADNTIKIHGLQAMFIGYVTVLFFNFDNVSTYLISFFFIGYSLYLIFLAAPKVFISPPLKTLPAKRTIATLFLALAISFAWAWNIRPFYLNEKIAHAKDMSQVGQCKGALQMSNGEDWEKSGIVKTYAILQYSDIVKNCASLEPQKETEYTKKVASLLKIAANAQPAFSRTWLFLGGFTNVLAAREENENAKHTLLEDSKTVLQKALKLSPARQEIFAELEKNYLVAQDYRAMETLGKECIAIDPRFGECYWDLGLAQIFLHKEDEGKKNVELAFQHGYDRNIAYKQLAVAYMGQKNWLDALASYQKVAQPNETLDPSGAASYHATLAYLYSQAGDPANAGKEALKVFSLEPENPETIQFITSLFSKKPNREIINSSLAFIYLPPGPRQQIYKAKAIYLQLVSNNPGNADYLWELMKVSAALEEYGNAYQEALAFIALKPSSKSDAEKFIKNLPGDYWKDYAKKR